MLCCTSLSCTLIDNVVKVSGTGVRDEELTMFSGEPMNPAFTRTARWLRLDRTTAACKLSKVN